MDNHEKARKIVDAIIAVDYGGDLKTFQDECGYEAAYALDIFWWLEDGHGDGMTVDECRLAWDL